MVELLKAATLWMAAGVEGSAAIVIGLAAIEAFLRARVLFVLRRETLGEPDAKEAVCLKQGQWLAVALELERSADVMRTAFVVLRTARNLFLQQDIDKA